MLPKTGRKFPLWTGVLGGRDTYAQTIAELVRMGNFTARPLFWTAVAFLLVCYLVGGWMVQQGYANGPAEIVVGSMTTTDPIVAVTFGLAVLGEGVLLGGWDAVGMVISGAVAVAGVVVLSKKELK